MLLPSGQPKEQSVVGRVLEPEYTSPVAFNACAREKTKDKRQHPE